MKPSVILATLFVPLLMLADTLTLRTNAELNGKITYDQNAFHVDAQYGTKHTVLTFTKRDVLMLEVNNRNANPGRAPSRISVFDLHSGATRNASRSAKKGETIQRKGDTAKNNQGRVLEDSQTVLPGDDVVWLSDGQKLAGKLVRIANGKIDVEVRGQRVQLDASQTKRIVVAATEAKQ